MFKFLREDSNISTIRVNTFIITIGSLILISAIAFNIIFKTINCDIVRWQSISIFLGGITALNSPFVYGKVKQKEVEQKSNQALKEFKEEVSDLTKENKEEIS